MRRIALFLAFLFLLPFACERWRGTETEARLEKVCSGLCGKMGALYSTGASASSFGCV